MKIETLSIVAGSEACQARCPFCVSKMTPERGMTLKASPVNFVRFNRALDYAMEGDANTAMITSKGEPTLFPGHITSYLSAIQQFEGRTGFRFRSREIQSNGIDIDQKPEKFSPLLKTWRALGLDLMAVSIVHFDPEKNRQVYTPYDKKYIDLPRLIDKLHGIDLKVRLACVLIDGFIDSAEGFEQLMDFAKKHGVDQLTARPVNKPVETRNDKIYAWIGGNYLKPEQYEEITQFVESKGEVVRTLAFGATIYDVDRQNVCLTNSLTPNTDPSYSRQLIFYPEGIIADDWTENARILP